MLQASMSTVLMAVITTNLLLILLTLGLRSSKILVRSGYKLLALFVVFSLIRILFPFELPFTITISLPLFLSKIIAILYSSLFTIGGHPISLWLLFRVIWGMGILFGLVKYLWSYYRAKHHIVLYSKDITRREPCHTILDQICAARGKRNTFRVLEMPGLQVPVLFGIFSPCILMPEHMDITEQEMRYILQHECSHHFHHDILLKNIIKLATIFYWWNPFCILLNQQTDLVLEMRIDDSVTLADADSSWAYMQCMIDVSERMVAQTNTDCTFTMALLPTGHSDLHQRFLLLTTNQVKRTRSLNILLLGITISIYLVSYAFIFEGYCSPDVLVPLYYTEENELTVVLSEDNIYLIDNADGTYDVYFNFEYLETTTSPELYPKDAPVYTKDTCPY